MIINSALGLEHDELVDFDGVQVHQGLVAPLSCLTDRAKKAGFDLALASGYRSFDRQLQIWNEKAIGQRPVLDDGGAELQIDKLSPTELVFAILRWSALPGASRHHWGTDIDVFDAGPRKHGYQLQLTVEETVAGGVFEAFYHWLDIELTSPGVLFFRPYTKPFGGVAPEPWHLSYRPLAKLYQESVSKIDIVQLLESSDLQLKSVVLDHFDEIYQRFIRL